tara:strand:- start:87 stop:434 length:348 start_codon:yes stop_codon:yes gene_type:complete
VGSQKNQPALEKLCQIIEERQRASTNTSYTASLLTKGTAKIGAKVTEEAEEVVFAALDEGSDALIRESADLLYHLCVLWVDQGIKLDDIWSELSSREGVSGLVEKSSRPKKGNES